MDGQQHPSSVNLPSVHKSSETTHLRHTLDSIFPPKTIKQLVENFGCLPCSLLKTQVVNKSLVSSVDCYDNHQNDEETCQYCANTLRQASAEPASRKTVLHLRHQLNVSLDEHQAKTFGICSIRRQIFDSCFDELIRQVTVSCVEQGLLLVRVRNELKASLDYYQKLFNSAVSYGISNSIQSELRCQVDTQKIHQLEKQIQDLEANLATFQRNSTIKKLNDVNTLTKLQRFHKSELDRRDEIIEQQKNIIRTLTRPQRDDEVSPEQE